MTATKSWEAAAAAAAAAIEASTCVVNYRDGNTYAHDHDNWHLIATASGAVIGARRSVSVEEAAHMFSTFVAMANSVANDEAICLSEACSGWTDPPAPDARGPWRPRRR